ncbi:organic hydroperoxide resistance protein [Sphingomonas sp. CGMCC 1.13654]|uniref:Organic hydroperoxide resistance protein n=1 Tax=Sphingomonas chungangi TaxID=2683589 RepID=A0A838L9K3_9SPHN|nr:organic hydroperoxide resistance protein [Sphingomonas chungangi]MBA2936113.1 organic hydroperoxide resistance protein [Sphingomonas chungangi]MVW55500.1 Ohr family peroxiredoxin [Sphingomonas chungangi]
MTILYRTEATSTGGRTGTSKTADGRLSVTLDTVKELGGAGGDGTNPEQLFAAGYSACFLGALKYVAGQKKVKIDEATTVTASVGIGPREDGQGFGLDIALSVAIPGVDRATAEELVAAADVVCPYSHLVHNGAKLVLSVA